MQQQSTGVSRTFVLIEPALSFKQVLGFFSLAACQASGDELPVSLKKKVRGALDTHGRTVLIRRPCVTVNYMCNGSPEYHVDLAIYAKRSDNLLDIAKGKENSATEYREWQASDPKMLTKVICEAFSEVNDLAQYRRCIKYIKRWRDFQFRNGGAPLSIALTVAAKMWFKPKFETSGKPADLRALLDWINSILNNFVGTNTAEGYHKRLRVDLPVSPYSDLMEYMTKQQMGIFHANLEALRDALNDAYDEDLPEDACKLLIKQFGDDFKVPEKSQTAKAAAAPVISTGHSA